MFIDLDAKHGILNTDNIQFVSSSKEGSILSIVLKQPIDGENRFLAIEFESIDSRDAAYSALSVQLAPLIIGGIIDAGFSC